MAIVFPGSDKPTLGVEIELQIIDLKSGDLVPESEKIIEVCESQRLERVKTEIHQSMLEIDSEIAEDVKQCRYFLNNRLVRLSNIVESLELGLSITGTHPSQHWKDRLISNSTRYQDLHEKFQWLARRMNIYGLHVHVGVSTGDRALAICQAMDQYLPCLLALSANSPFWHGIDTGMQSSRMNILDTFPFGKMPFEISRWENFEHYYDALNRAGAIKSFKDFYWYVRPNLLYGTVEIRICDAMSTLDETMALVALIQCLVAKINMDIDCGDLLLRSVEFYWISPENLRIAARDGLDGMIIQSLDGEKVRISDIILNLIETLSPISKSLNCYEELSYLYNILEKGNGAQKQRDIYNKTGSFKSVILESCKELKCSLDLSLIL